MPFPRALFSWMVVMLGCGVMVAQEASILQLPETLSNDSYVHWSRLVVNEGSLTVFGTNQSTSEVVTWTPGDGLHVVPGSAGKTLRLVSPDGERIVVASGSPSIQSLVNVATGQVDPLAARPPPEGYSAISTVAHGFLGNGRLLRLSESRPLAGFGNKVQAWILNPNDMTEVEVPASSPAGTAYTLVGHGIFFSSGTTRRIMGRGFSSLWFTDDEGFSKEVGPYPNYAILQNAVISANGLWAVCDSRGLGEPRIGDNVGDLIDLGAATPVLRRLSQLPRFSSSPAGHGELSVSSVLNDGTILGTVQGTGPGYSDLRTVCVWHANGARVRLKDALQEHFGISMEETQLQGVVGASPDGTQILVSGASPNQAGRSVFHLITLPTPLPWKPGIPKMWAMWWKGAHNTELPVKFDPLLKDYFTGSVSVSLVNTGDAPLEITNIVIDGPSAAKFTCSLTEDFPTVPVGGKQGLGIHYTATGPETDTATMRIYSNDPAAPVLVIPIEAQGPAPVLSLTLERSSSAGPLVFAAAVGREVEASVVLSNLGNRAATQVVPEIVDDSEGEFSIVSAPVENLDTSTTLTVRCTPRSAGIKHCQIQVTSATPGANVETMDVTVHAYAPKMLEIEDEAGLPLNLPEEPLLFGQASINNDIYAGRSFYLHNSGTEDLEGFTFRLTGAASGEYISTPSTVFLPGVNDSRTIKAGSRLQVHLSFNPKNLLSREASLVIDNPGHFVEPLEIRLMGEGVARGAPVFVSSPDSEINTLTLQKAVFRLTGASPMLYRVVKDGAADMPGDWKSAYYENAVTMNLSTQDQNKDLAIEVRNSHGTARSPVFRRIHVTLPPTQVDTLPASKWPKFVPSYPGFMVTGVSRAVFEWFRDATSLGISGAGIQFPKASAADEGSYTCRVSVPLIGGGHTSVLLGPVILNVIGAPQVIPFTLRPASVLESVSWELKATDNHATPTKFRVSGLPPGITYNATTHRVGGHVQPSAAPKAPRDYRVKVQASNAVGAGPVHEVTWRILPYQPQVSGTYHATISRHDWEPLGQLSGFTTTTISTTGSYSSQTTIHGVTYRKTGKIRNVKPVPAEPAQAQDPLLNDLEDVMIFDPSYSTRADPLRMLLMTFRGDDVDGSLGLVQGQVVRGCKVRPAPAHLIKADPVARHHFALKMLGNPAGVEPGNSGFLAASLLRNGACNLVFRMPDGVGFTASTGIGRRSDTSAWMVPLHQVGYSKKGAVTGRLLFPDDETLSQVELDWYKASPVTNLMGALFPSIHAISLEGEGSHYQAGAASGPWQQAFDFTLPGANAICRLQGAAPISDTAGILKLDSKGTITAPSPQPAPMASLRATWSAATGLFTIHGSASSQKPGTTLLKPVGSLTGQALWIPHLRSGVGNFIFTRTPSSPPPETGWIRLSPSTMD